MRRTIICEETLVHSRMGFEKYSEEKEVEEKKEEEEEEVGEDEEEEVEKNISFS